MNAAKLNEEINLLYVAVTRTKNSIHIPENLLPIDFPRCDQIHVMKLMNEEEKEEPATTKPNAAIQKKEIVKEKAYKVEAVREKHVDAYKPWTNKLDEELTVMYCEKRSIPLRHKQSRRNKNIKAATDCTNY